MNNCSARIIVSGKVQGVGFRFFVYKNAIELNLSGYAKNLFDGSVEVYIEGEIDNINMLIDQMKIGPSRSIISNLKKFIADEILNYKGFDIY